MTAHPPAGRNAAAPATMSVVDPAVTCPGGCARPEASLTGAAAPSAASAAASRYVVVALSASVVSSCRPPAPAAVRYTLRAVTLEAPSGIAESCTRFASAVATAGGGPPRPLSATRSGGGARGDGGGRPGFPPPRRRGGGRPAETAIGDRVGVGRRRVVGQRRHQLPRIGHVRRRAIDPSAGHIRSADRHLCQRHLRIHCGV